MSAEFSKELGKLGFCLQQVDKVLFLRSFFDSFKLMKNSQDVYQTLQNYKEEINKCLFKGLPIFVKDTVFLIPHRQTKE